MYNIDKTLKMKKIILTILIIGFAAAGFFYFKPNSISEPSPDDSAGFRMDITSEVTGLKPETPQEISFRILDKQDQVYTDFAIAHEKIMHFIVVRKDLTNFHHLHPEFNSKSGEFNTTVIFPTDGPYRIYADFTPATDNPQRLAVSAFSDLEVGKVDSYKPEATVPDENYFHRNGPFNISYFLGNTPVKAGSQLDYGLTVESTTNDEQVQLEPYLGSRGHSVIIKEGSLEYLHTHSTSMDMTDMEDYPAGEHAGHHMSEPDTVDFSAVFPESGTYRMFNQFKVNQEVFTDIYTLRVEQ